MFKVIALWISTRRRLTSFTLFHWQHADAAAAVALNITSLMWSLDTTQWTQASAFSACMGNSFYVKGVQNLFRYVMVLFELLSKVNFTFLHSSEFITSALP